MAQASSIEWTQATWNPVVGCRKVSDGRCHCLPPETWGHIMRTVVSGIAEICQ